MVAFGDRNLDGRLDAGELLRFVLVLDDAPYPRWRPALRRVAPQARPSALQFFCSAAVASACPGIFLA